MSIFSFIGGIFKPAADLIDNLHTSDEEKMTLQNKFKELENEASAKMIGLEEVRIGLQEKLVGLEKKFLEERSKIVVAEANSNSWIAQNWRPIASLSLVIIIVLDSFGVCTANQAVYSLAQLFLGIYGGSRGLEKISKNVKIMGGK